MGFGMGWEVPLKKEEEEGEKMDTIWMIRAGIFLVAGLMVLLFPERVYKFQIYLNEKMPFNYNVGRDRKYYSSLGIVFIIISIILFVYAR